MLTYEPPALDAEIEELLNAPVTADPVATDGIAEGVIVEAKVHEIDEDWVYVQLDDEQFGRCDVDDVTVPGSTDMPAIGDTVRVLLEEPLDEGTWAVSIAKAALIDVFDQVAGWKKEKKRVRGRVNLVVRGGFAVDAFGLRCFLPGRESGIRHAEALEAIGHTFDFEVIRFDRKDAQPVLSRRALAAEERKAAEAERLGELEVGQVIEGRVTSVKPFGVFVDLGGVDGLCHVSELSAGHVEDPSSVVRVGDPLTVTITEIDSKRGRIGLSRREIIDAEQRERVAALEEGATVEGKVTRLANFGAFVEVEEGVEGLLHVSELSWTERHNHPSEVLAEGQTVTLKVLKADAETGRIALSLRALEENPWATLESTYPAGSVVTGEITRIEDYGLFVKLAEGIEGLCHISDLTWEGRPARPSDVDDYQIGGSLEVKVLSIDNDRGRVSLGVKQLAGDPWDDAGDRATVGTVFTAPVVRFEDKAAFVQVADKLEGRLYIAEISDERVESVRSVLRIGQEVEVMTTNADRQRRRLDVSIKAVRAKIEAETPKSYADDDTEMNPLAAALQQSGLTDDE